MSTLANDTGIETIENATRDDVRAGDHLIWKWVRKRGDLTLTAIREGIAHRRDEDGDWNTKDGEWITDGENHDWGPNGSIPVPHGEHIEVTLTIRRPAPELPPERDDAVLVPADEHKFTEAEEA